MTTTRWNGWMGALCSALGLLGCEPPPAAPPTSAHLPRAPRLILQITIDQLRGDQPAKMLGRAPNSGLDALLTSGVHYEQAHYDHANTETAVGHATLFTGATPAMHGMVGNEWYSRETGALVYNVEDPGVETLEYAGERSSRGVSPRNLLVPTWGDALVQASKAATRVFSVSVKDRGAIIPAGHRGKAFWFSKQTGAFVSSTYYYDALPGWVATWNARRLADRYQARLWEFTQPKAWYTFTSQDDRAGENRDLPHFGRVFPHPYSPADKDLKRYYTAVTSSPAGDELVVDFALELIRAERLGTRDATDVLCVSLSSTDYVGHMFGPDSVEAEDNLVRLGRTLHRLLESIDDAVGLDQTWVVLSSDHGAGLIPEEERRAGGEGGRVDASDLIRHLNDGLARRFHAQEPWVRGFRAPYVYLREDLIGKQGVALPAVETEAAALLEDYAGIEATFTAHDIRAARAPSSDVARRVLNNYYAPRSGNVHVVEQQGWLMEGAPYDQELATGHGSPWPYDTHVPILVRIPGVAPNTLSRQVSPRDIAPTMLGLLGLPPPPSMTTTGLTEVLTAAAADEAAR